MSHIFLSYSKVDIEFARHVRQLLEDSGFSVWMDETSLVPSDRWWSAIEQNIRTCAAFVVIMSPDGQTSRWVERELLLAERKDVDKPVFPVLYKGEVWARLADLQYESMRAGTAASLTSQFVQRLEVYASRFTGSLPPPQFDEMNTYDDDPYEEADWVTEDDDPEPVSRDLVLFQPSDFGVSSSAPAASSAFQIVIPPSPQPAVVKRSSSSSGMFILLLIGLAVLAFAALAAGVAIIGSTGLFNMLMSTPTYAPNPTAASYFNQGYTAAQNDAYADALNAFTQAIMSDPNYAFAYFWRGYVNGKQRYFQSALEDYTRAITLDPFYATAYNNRCFVYNELSNYQQAIADCTRSIELDPSSFSPWNNRCYAYKNFSDYERAVTDCLRATAIDPTAPAPYVFIGEAYYHLGRYQDSLYNYQRYVELQPSALTSYTGRITELQIMLGIITPTPTPNICILTAQNDINIRSSPDTSSSTNIIGQMAASETRTALYYRNVDTYIWYQLSGGGWVRSDVVTETSPCYSLPYG
ncbi:MAG: toll/interleukin-1 receptor domain-containing protein [Anaerolinea sp.]|nr:toll/interleukin-1 receptor domain-containing protein [Anaerolinea sp.]